MKEITKERIAIKIDKENKKSFGFINSTFINIYSKDNPILNIDDECYFLFAHPIDFHRTLIGKGKVTQQIFIDGMNTLYYISLEEILENPNTINKFVYGKKFNLWKFDEGKLFTSRLLLITEQTTSEFLKTNLFKAESFFVRKTEEDIRLLQKEYTEIIRTDIIRQLSEVNDLLEITE